MKGYWNICLQFINTCNEFISDRTFMQIFIPLYNYDSRRIGSTLLHSAKMYHISKERSKRYGMRGVFLYEFFNGLSTENFLSDYFNKSPDIINGYCNIDRVLLTVLINKSERSYRLVRGGISSPIELFSVVKDLYVIYKYIDYRILLINLFGHIVYKSIFHVIIFTYLIFKLKLKT